MSDQLWMGFILLVMIGIFFCLFQSAKNKDLIMRLDVQLLEVKKVIEDIIGILDMLDKRGKDG